MDDIVDNANLAVELPPPTSDAGTRETEPEVVAGIASAEGSPDLPLAVRTAPPRYGLRAVLMVGGGLAFGLAAALLLRRT